MMVGKTVVRPLLHNYPKTTDFGAKVDGFNVLNTPKSMYKNPGQFWEQYNKPFLDKAIQRGDDIVIATKPTAKVMNRILPDGKTVRSGFGKEVDYLKSKGYEFDPDTSTMRKK